MSISKSVTLFSLVPVCGSYQLSIKYFNIEKLLNPAFKKAFNPYPQHAHELVTTNFILSPRSSFLGLKALKASELIDTFTVNVVAPLMLTKAFLPLLKKASASNNSEPLGVKRAAIVNMSSILGSIAANTDGSLYHYRVTKSGVNAATKSLSIDLKNDKVLVVSMHPGKLFISR